MNKIILLLVVAAFAFSPVFVTSAQAGQGKHHKVVVKHVKHHKGHHGKHHKKG
jgi:Spy/CpxP family protein refolding chaperone